MRRLSIFASFIALLIAPAVGFAADFNVGKSTLTIAKINGEATLSSMGRQTKGSGLINSSLEPGASLYIGPKSEVWLKVVEEKGGKQSFLRLSTNTCGTICKYDKSAGVVSTSAFSSGAECERAQSFHDRAKDIAGLPKQNFSQAQTSSMVSFASSAVVERRSDSGGVETKGESGERVTTPQASTPEYVMPPLVFVPGLPGVMEEEPGVAEPPAEPQEEGEGQQQQGEKEKRGGASVSLTKRDVSQPATVVGSKLYTDTDPKASLKSETISNSDILNQAPNTKAYIPGSTNITPPAAPGATKACPPFSTDC